MVANKIKKNINLIFYIFVLLSLFYLVRHLRQNNLLSFPQHLHYRYLMFSFLFLLCGFMFNCLSWKQVLKNNGIRLSLKDSAISIGVSIFGKYIPGKLWLIMGMSGKVAQKANVPLGEVVIVSTILQIMIIVIGTVIGVSCLYKTLPIIYIISFYLAVLVLGCVFFALKNKISSTIDRISSSFIRKWVRPLADSMSVSLVIMISLTWCFWSVGFHMLVRAFLPAINNPIIGFSFALASSIGILIIIAPGGLGVREGLLGLLLSPYMDTYINVAAFSRLWFFIGEVVMFIMALLLILIDRCKLGRTDNNTS